ncbi:AMP-binding protein [Streptomyces griseorubiginosus]|nr:AMP-binding protein [Streptomyces griseorubiginosus]
MPSHANRREPVTTPPTFQALWDEAVRRHADRTFLVFRPDDRSAITWTYREFDEIVARVSGTLAESGVTPGSSVHIGLRNSPAFVAAWLATARLGAWMTPVDPASTQRDITRQVGRVKPVAGLCAAARAEVYHDGADGRIPRVFELAEDETDLAPGAALMSGPPVRDPVPVVPSDRLAVMFTSGTTSEPKGVLLSQACYGQAAETMSAVIGLQARHRWYVTLPLFHANAQYYCFASAVATGASVALTASFSASRWVALARELEVTHASLFAAPIRMILARHPADQPPAVLEHVWFAQNLSPDHHAAFAKLTGIAPRQLYGMTETVAIVTADLTETPLHDVIGQPIGGRRVRLEDPVTGEDSEPGVPGQLLVRGTPGIDLFHGYLDNEAATRKVLRPDGEAAWFATGDLVTADQHGTLRFVGRIDDVIKVSGENVSLAEVEATLTRAPGVFEIAVIAQPDPVYDQVPIAYVVPQNTAQPPQPDELDAWAVRHLTPAARPRAWHFIDELPRTSVGKVRRFQVGR